MKKEMHTGYDCEGNKKWMVVSVDESGRWMHVEDFKTEDEANSWIKWA